LGDFTPQTVIDAAAAAPADEAADEVADEAADEKDPLVATSVIILLITAIAGFFATAGAAGTDIASNNRDANDVQLGGLTGIALATIVSCGLAVLVIAGAYGKGLVSADNMGSMNPVELIGDVMGERTVRPITVLLAISSFPPACFSAFIAANSFRTTLPNVNPFISVGIGAAFSIVLAATGVISDVLQFFGFIAATFGPVCGAMAADYLLTGKKWAGPRAGFNPAGWISWVAGAVLGLSDIIPGLAGKVPCPPIAALATGFVLYLVLAKIGLQSQSLEMPGAAEEQPAPDPGK
jgi:cytosine permease